MRKNELPLDISQKIPELIFDEYFIKNTETEYIKIPYKIYYDNAKMIGLVDYYDLDENILRQIPLLYKNNSITFPHLSLSVFSYLTDSKITYKKSSLFLGKRKIPMIKREIISLIGMVPGGVKNKVFKYYSFKDLLVSEINVENGFTPIYSFGGFSR